MTREKAMFFSMEGESLFFIGWDTHNGVYWLGADEVGSHDRMIPVNPDDVLDQLRKAKDGIKYYAVVDGATADKVSRECGITEGLF